MLLALRAPTCARRAEPTTATSATTGTCAAAPCTHAPAPSPQPAPTGLATGARRLELTALRPVQGVACELLSLTIGVEADLEGAASSSLGNVCQQGVTLVDEAGEAVYSQEEQAGTSCL